MGFHRRPNSIPATFSNVRWRALRQMTKSLKPSSGSRSKGARKEGIRLTSDYFRIRDFEYAQPLYDLAFLLEVDAIFKGQEIPKYRTFSLWRAAYSLDGYGTTFDRWLDGTLTDLDL